MTEFLKCIGKPSTGNVTVGRCYGITKRYVDWEGDECYEIVADDGRALDYTVYPDVNGASYATWFTLGEAEE